MATGGYSTGDMRLMPAVSVRYRGCGHVNNTMEGDDVMVMSTRPVLHDRLAWPYH